MLHVSNKTLYCHKSCSICAQLKAFVFKVTIHIHTHKTQPYIQKRDLTKS